MTGHVAFPASSEGFTMQGQLLHRLPVLRGQLPVMSRCKGPQEERRPGALLCLLSLWDRGCWSLARVLITAGYEEGQQLMRLWKIKETVLD